ncbi:MAG: phosphotransferase [Patescibacteria group bacterium]|nr:phosphotransferase [Patescibacteria group bacterium]MDD4304510.1 phosphotransferase [Patescibacteria group bacterium]MDD4694870.1 phosphotransferase [Patescibacteria group bacterium]
MTNRLLEKINKDYSLLKIIPRRQIGSEKYLLSTGNSRIIILKKYDTKNEAKNEINNFLCIKKNIPQEYLPKLYTSPIFLSNKEQEQSIAFEYYSSYKTLDRILKQNGYKLEYLQAMNNLFSEALLPLYKNTSTGFRVIRNRLPIYNYANSILDSKFLKEVVRKIDRLEFAAPHTTIHGDLHPRNIILDGCNIKMIDFEYILSNECIYYDFSRFELFFSLHYPFPINWEKHIRLMYRKGNISNLSESSSKSCLFNFIVIIRSFSTKFSTQLYNNQSQELIDIGYCKCLFYDLIWVITRETFPLIARKRAVTLFLYLYNEFKNIL